MAVKTSVHARVSENEQVDKPTSTAYITSGLHLCRAEVLRGLRNFLNMDRPEIHSIDRLKDRGVEKGSGRHSLGRLLRDREERVWAFPSATMTA